jgi:hypothetical protein
MRRSLACGGLPADQTAWVLAEAARLLDERDRARSLIAELVRPMADVRGLLNELHALLGPHPPQRARPVGGDDTGEFDPSSCKIERRDNNRRVNLRGGSR